MQEENERVLSGAITESTLRYGLKAARRRVRLREEFVRLAQSGKESLEEKFAQRWLSRSHLRDFGHHSADCGERLFLEKYISENCAAEIFEVRNNIPISYSTKESCIGSGLRFRY